jgi:hypothetical protein
MVIRQEWDRAPGVATREAAVQLAGMFHSGRSDISVRHDDYLDESYAG